MITPVHDSFVPVVQIAPKYNRDDDSVSSSDNDVGVTLAKIPKEDIDKKDGNDLTPVMRAVIDNDESAVRRYATHGADLELTTNFEVDGYSDFEGVTALGIAAILGNQNMVMLLAALGAHPQGGETCPPMLAFQVGENNDDTTKLTMDIVKARKLQSIFSKVS